MEPLDINEGEALTLRCRLEGSPEISVAWFKAGRKLSQSHLCSVAFTAGVATLKLSRTTKFDRGEYVCKAENLIGAASASCHVSVKGDCLFVSALMGLLLITCSVRRPTVRVQASASPSTCRQLKVLMVRVRGHG